MNRPLSLRLGWLLVFALAAAGCQRTLVTLTTPTPFGGAGTAAPERSAVIEDVSGTVEWRPSADDQWVPAAVSQSLNQGAELRTGGDSRAGLRLTEGSKIYLGASTEASFRLLNPFLDSHLTALNLTQGVVWVLLNSGALDVITPAGVATARGAYLSAEVADAVNITCLEGVCGFESVLVPAGYKLLDAADNDSPEQMSFADLGVWGVNVPESTEIAFLATEAVVQGSATPPILPTATQTPTERPSATSTDTPAPTDTAEPTETATTPPDVPTATPQPPTATLAPSDTPVPSRTPVPSPTLPVFQPTVTRPPSTPIPAAPVIGRHVVLPGETIFCIGRGYGVLPGAIATANNLPATFQVRSGQVLDIPQVQWVNISAGPVCAPQFASPFPGLPVATATNPATSTPAGPPLSIFIHFYCTSNCGSDQGDYVVHYEVQVTGGVPPYQYNPAQTFDLTLSHCAVPNPSGTVSVTSADGQSANATWVYDDPNCGP